MKGSLKTGRNAFAMRRTAPDVPSTTDEEKPDQRLIKTSRSKGKKTIASSAPVGFRV